MLKYLYIPFHCGTDFDVIIHDVVCVYCRLMAHTATDIQMQQDRLNEMKTADEKFNCDDPDCRSRKPYVTITPLVSPFLQVI